MERIVQGIVFEGNYVEGAFDIRTWENNGVTEVSARQVIEWTEKRFDYEPGDPRALQGHGYMGQPTEKQRAEWERQDEEDKAERRERSLKKAAQRAKTTCRRVIITEGFDELLTLTYRENQDDRELCKKHFKEWVRRMKKALGEFRYCGSFEVQDRGAMHVHVATHRLPKLAKYKGAKVKAWQVGTKVWRDIVGDNNGLCFVGAKKTKFGSSARHKMSLAKMANYVSKYIMKDYEKSPEESNRYSRSNGTVVPKATVARFTNLSTVDLINICFHVGEGDVVVSMRLNPWHDGFWFCTEQKRDKRH